jgi:hypothetical protein
MAYIPSALGREAERLALADYKAVAGRIIEVTMISGYNDRNDSVDINDIPILVRVDKGMQPHSGLLHWNEDFLYPYWDATAIREYPELKGLRSLWTYGKSYRVADGQVLEEQSSRSFRVLNPIEALKAQAAAVIAHLTLFYNGNNYHLRQNETTRNGIPHANHKA